MGRWVREPSAFLAFYKTFVSVEEDRKPSAPKPFYSASNCLVLRLAMAPSPLFCSSSAQLYPPSAGAETWGGQGPAPLIKVILRYKFPNSTKIIRAFLYQKIYHFLFFSKLDLSAYLSYCILFIAFYLKHCSIFYHSLSKSSLKSRSNARGIIQFLI